MERTSSWLISIFIVMFWVFRIILAILTQSEGDWAGFVVFNYNVEIVLIFITLLSVLLIAKRKVIGAIIYLITYVYYFGGYIYRNMLPVIVSGGALEGAVIQNGMISLIAILLAIFTIIDLLLEKLRKNKYTDSKTDWFFDDKKTDRKIDDRVDKNQYKMY